MESLKCIYNLLPIIINSLLSDENEQGLCYEELTEAMVMLCSHLNGNSVPMSHTRLKGITTTEFDITLEALIISGFYHYKKRMEQTYDGYEESAFYALTLAMKTLHIRIIAPELLKNIPRAHVLKVLFNINRTSHVLAA